MKKKLLTMTLAVLLPLGLLAGSGDVNGDGKIDVTDIVELVNHLKGTPSEKFNIGEADVNNDGKVDEDDVNELVKIIFEGKKVQGESYSMMAEPKEVIVYDSNEWQQFDVKVSVQNTSLLEGLNYEILGDGYEWIIYNSRVGETFLFDVLPSISGINQTAKIVFHQNEYDLHDTVTVTRDVGYKYVEYEKKEYHIINCYDENYRRLFMKAKHNVSWAELNKRILYGGDDWIEPLGSYDLTFTNNLTGKNRDVYLEIGNEQYGICDTIHIIQYPSHLGNMSGRHILVCEPAGDILEIPVVGNTTLDIGIEGLEDYMHLLSNEVRGNDNIIRIKVDENDSEEERHGIINIKVGDNDPVAFDFAQAGCNAPSFTEQKDALAALYNATNGAQWLNSENWLTDKPINSWYGVNESIIGNYVVEVNLADNLLIGEIPSKASVLLEAFKPTSEGGWFGSVLSLSGNGLYGKIPDKVRNSSVWPTFGWDIIRQSLWVSGGRLLECKDWGLKVDNYAIDDVRGNLTSSEELFAKYKLSTIMTGSPSDEMVNLHMSYQNKGYGTIYSSYDWLGGTREELVEAVDNAPIDIEGIWNCEWADRQLVGLRTTGSWFVIDDEGKLVCYLGRDWDIPESWYVSKVDSICRARLGEPEEHEPYSSTYYTSREYLHDGDVVTLQQATVGNGIDIVLMGDAYVDKDMDDGGKYETDMRQGMEEFFAVEPYKSFRDRFNVFAVKVVSPNSHIGDGCKQKLNYDDAVCFQYAQRVDGVDMDNVTVVNIVNNPNSFFVEGHANMYDNGSSVAHIEVGGPSSIIVHEAGGHGFAKLLDEYIFGGYEDNQVQDQDRDSFREMIKTDYHDKGWGMNVSATDNPNEVPWAHFLKDDRYKDEVGVYQGAWMWPHDLWRPSESSVMNTDYTWFNAPSREAIYKRVMKLSEGDGWTYDFEKFAAFDAPIREAYKAAKSRSRTRGAEVQKKRIESRPPTIYKGTWRDAGKCEKVEYTSKPASN